MKNSSFKSSVFGAIFAATGVVSTLVADPLLPGGAVEAPSIGPLASGTVVASDLTGFASGDISGQIGVTVLSGVASNVLGGLTFVYEIANLSALIETEGLTGFAIDGWAGVDMDVVTGGGLTGEGFYFSPNSSPVEEGFTFRSLDGNSILFDFPPGTSEPPIFSGENSFQLIVYTNATAWTEGNSGADGWDFDEFGAIVDGTYWSWSGSNSTLVAVAPVPDGGSTALLLGIGFMAMGLSLARSRQAVARK